MIVRLLSQILILVCGCALVFALPEGSPGAPSSATVTLSDDEIRLVARHVVPLPKRMEISQLALVANEELTLLMPLEDNSLVGQMEADLSTAFRTLFAVELKVRRQANLVGRVVLTNQPEKVAEFAIDTGQLARLGEVRVPSEAYIIRSFTASGDRPTWQATTIAALDNRGLFYGVQTLVHMLRGVAKLGKHARGVAIPIAAVDDWPDLPERGLWGAYALERLPWLAERKMNLVETHATRLTVTPEGRGEASLDPQLIAEASRRAIRLIPIITHLDQLRRTRIFERYPHVFGKGDPKRWPNWVDGPVCWAQEDARQVLADWVSALAAIDGVDAVTVWLSEAPVQCECDTCAQANQYIQETKATLAAWETARKNRPQLRLRILLTQGSYPVNDQILALVPREVEVIYYDGGRTYTSSHAPLIEPRLVEFVNGGGWLGVCPQLTASWRIVSPFSGACFIRARMEEFINKGLQCLYGYATPGIAYWDFNVEAAAEWTWNLAGRSTREFAAAWAVRQNMPEPELVADWSETLGPAAWDVYACGVPYPWFFNQVAGAVRAGRPIRPGEGPLAEITTAEQLARDLQAAKDALALAERIGHPRLVTESRVILAYLEILSTLPEITALLAKVRATEALSAEEQSRLEELAGRVEKAGQTLEKSLWEWARVVNPDVDKNPPSRFVDTVRVCRQTADAIAEAAKAAGAR